jgi:hypothetical protein
MKELNKKLTTGNTIVTQADKGKNIVIINSKEYSKKVHSFLIANNFNTSTKDPTDKLQKLINKTRQDCNLITDKGHKILNTKETFTTHTLSPTKVAQNRYSNPSSN